MTKKELFERHESMCESCNIKNCDGIHMTTKNTTICEKGEMKEPIPQEISTEVIENDIEEKQNS